MTISGGIKFFDLNLADSKTGATAAASSGNPSAGFVLDRNQYTVWRSVGSDDTTAELITITLPSPVLISRIFLGNHNFTRFQMLWNDGGGPYDFTNVIGVNGVASAKIEELTYGFNSSYYEFDEVLADQIIIAPLKTQIPNQEKFLNSFVATSELGTLQGYPLVPNATKDKKLRKSTLLNGRSFITKSLEVFRTTINFKNYPPGMDADLDLIYLLFDRDDNFFVWLCGGRAGEPYFKYPIRGFRLEDLKLVQTVNVFKDKYRKNLYNSMVDVKLKLEEAG